MRFFKPHKNNLPPDRGQIVSLEAGLRRMNYKWMLNEQQKKAYEKKVAEGVDMFLDASAYASHIVMASDPRASYMSEFEIQQLLENLTPEEYDKAIAEYNYRKDLFSQIDWDEIIGDSPLEKAMNLATLAEFIQQESENPDSDGNCKDGKGNSPDARSRAKSAGTKAAEGVNELSKQIKAQNALKQKIESNEQGDDRALGKGGRGENLNSFISLNDYDISKITPDQLKVLRNFDQVSKRLNLKSVDEAQVLKDMTLTKHIPQQGDINVVFSQNTEIQDIELIPEAMFTNPLWLIDALSGDLMIPWYWNVTPTKRMVFAFVDNSGSMSDSRKISYVKSIITHYIAEVANGDTEFFLMKFIESYTTFHKIDKPSKIKFVTNSYLNFSGGTTYVGKVIKSFAKDVHSGFVPVFDYPGTNTIKYPLDHMKIAKLIIINDGQDEISSDALDTLIEKLRQTGVIVIINAFAIGEDNAYLKDLCLKTNGMYKYVPLH